MSTSACLWPIALKQNSLACARLHDSLEQGQLTAHYTPEEYDSIFTQQPLNTNSSSGRDEDACALWNGYWLNLTQVMCQQPELLFIHECKDHDPKTQRAMAKTPRAFHSSPILSYLLHYSSSSSVRGPGPRRKHNILESTPPPPKKY